jgi:hypothetical protein
MTTKTKGRNGGDRPTLKTINNRDINPIKRTIKALIVYLGLWAVIPPALATWLLARMGLKHE